MSDMFEAVRAEPINSAMPVKRQKAKPFANAERLKRGEQVDKPSGRGLASSILDTGLSLAAIGALLIAALITTYVAVKAADIRLPVAVPQLDEGLMGNFIVSALFFWLEVIAIVLGVRLLDRSNARRLAIRQLFAIQKLTSKLVNDIEDARYAFAVELDKNIQDDGRYTVNFGQLNVTINVLKNTFLEHIYCDVELTATANHIVTRLLRLLDFLSADTFDLANEAEALNRHDPAALGKCLDAMFDRTVTDGLRTIVTLLDNIRARV